MAIKFSISSMLQLTACIAVLFASYGLLPTLPGFKPGFERLVFTLCLAGAFFPSLVISLCWLPVTSRYCWQSMFNSTIISSWIWFLLWHPMCLSHSAEPNLPGLAYLGLLIAAVFWSFIIAIFTAALTTSIQRFRLLVSGRTIPCSNVT